MYPARIVCLTEEPTEVLYAIGEEARIVGFSDIQADIAQALVKRGIEVWIANHRSVEGIIGYVRRLGGMVGAAAKADRYAIGLEAHVAQVKALAQALPRTVEAAA